MRKFLKNILKYHLNTNQQLADFLLTHQEDITERTISLFSHNVNVHQIWNARILNIKEFGVNELHTIAHCKMLDRSNYNTTIEILESFNLNTLIHYKNTNEDTFENSVKDILFHVTNHMTHHRGQIISDLRQHGIAPPETDYIYYKQ